MDQFQQKIFNFLDEILLHYWDNFFYIIYKEEESPYKNETTKNVYPAREVSESEILTL